MKKDNDLYIVHSFCDKRNIPVCLDNEGNEYFNPNKSPLYNREQAEKIAKRYNANFDDIDYFFE